MTVIVAGYAGKMVLMVAAPTTVTPSAATSSQPTVAAVRATAPVTVTDGLTVAAADTPSPVVARVEMGPVTVCGVAAAKGGNHAAEGVATNRACLW